MVHFFIFLNSNCTESYILIFIQMYLADSAVCYYNGKGAFVHAGLPDKDSISLYRELILCPAGKLV